MTLQSPPAYVQAGTYTAVSDRLHLVSAITMRDVADAFRAFQGFYPDRFPTYSNPSGMNWSVSSCAGVITNTFVTGGGDYRFANPSTVTGSFAAANATQNRNDILGFRIRDNFYDSSGFNDVTPVVVQGTLSSGTPVDPALPSSFIPILRAVINAGVTSPTLQDLRTRTNNSGGVLPVDNLTQRAALGTVHTGTTILRTDKGWTEYYDGSAWRVNGTVRASALADITNPLTHQLAELTTDQVLYRWSGSAWLATANLSDTGGIVHYRRSTGVGSVSSGAPVKLGFGTAISASATDVVVSGVGNTDFTLQRSGTWLLQSVVPWISTTNASFWGYIASSSNQAVRYAVDARGSNNTTLTCNPQKTLRLAAGTALSVYAFQDTGGSKDINPTEADCDFIMKFLGA